MSLAQRSIGAVAKEIGVSVHTLRYYEKIGLLSLIAKDTGGRRQYEARDVERIRFIRRAQRMHFTLNEIHQLIELERSPSITKQQAQKLVKEKLGEIDQSLGDLIQLKVDLSTMLADCLHSSDDEECPIIETIKDNQ